MNYHDCDDIDELKDYIIDSFEDALTMSRKDIFTRAFFRHLLDCENTDTFAAYEMDVESFNVFVYKKDGYYSYYIPDELREIIRKQLNM